MRILLVEDDEMIGEAVADGLKGEGYAVDWVKDGNSAIIALDTTPFSLVILDLGLPGKDGLAVLKEIRFRKNHTPVLVTTARDTVNDRIEGLDAGADDYLIKEYALLFALAERPGIVLSRAQLEEKLYNYESLIGSNAIEVHIHHLRKKLSEDSIKTVRGVGYVLET